MKPDEPLPCISESFYALEMLFSYPTILSSLTKWITTHFQFIAIGWTTNGRDNASEFHDLAFRSAVCCNLPALQFIAAHFHIAWDNFVPPRFFSGRDKTLCSIAQMKEILLFLLDQRWKRDSSGESSNLLEEAYAEHEFEFVFWLFAHGWRILDRSSPVMPFMNWYFSRHPTERFPLLSIHANPPPGLGEFA